MCSTNLWRHLATAPLFLLAAAAAAQPTAKKLITDPREVIALEEGVWDAIITTPPRTPAGKPTIVTGVQVNELRSDGMWMLNRMSANGGAYEGTGIWGYDVKTGRFSGAWVDNGYGRVRMDDGQWDPATRTMTWTSVLDRPNGRTVQMRATSTFAGNTRTYRSFALTNAGEVLQSLVVFTRRTR